MMRDALIVELINVDGQNLVTIPYIYIYIYSSIEFNHVAAFDQCRTKSVILP